MSSADWEEVKRLAADFQRAQLSSNLQKLSERNCVEIINKLVELNLLDILHTNDGKEYITPAQLSREIQDEIFIRGGRVNIADLVDTLSMDHSVLERHATQLARSQAQLYYVLGQLITRTYLDSVAEEVNERLQQNGVISIVDLVKQYDLPGDFMLEVVVERLGGIIQGHQDTSNPNIIYTEGFIARHQAHVRGVLSAITKPTPVSAIISQYQFQERLFYSVAEKLIAKGRVCGVLTGNRQTHGASYIPNIHSRTQNEWLDNFFKQNGYLEFEALRGLNISDPEGYIRRRFKDKDLTYMGGVCVGPGLRDQVDAAIDDAIINGSWVDIYPLCPTVFSLEEVGELVEMCLKRRGEHGGRRGASGGRLVGGTVVVSEVLITKLNERFTQLMPQRAKIAVEKGAFKEQVSKGKVKMDDDGGRNKKEDRRKKAAGGKSGGGTQGRETKTKATKNKLKGRKQHVQDSDDEDNCHKSDHDNKMVEFMSQEELQAEITKFEDLEDVPEEVIDDLSNDLMRPLTQQFQEVAKGVFLATLSSGGEAGRKTHQQLQDKVAALLTTIRLSEKSIKMFDEDKQVQLRRHLLRSQCAELVSEVLTYLAQTSLIDIPNEAELTPEMRVKVIGKLAEDLQGPLMSVNKSLTGSELDDFNKTVDDAIAAAGIIIKKKDNKKDRQVLLSHRSALVEQVEGSLDAPLTLHLACLLLFQAVTGLLLTASGKFVPQILAFLRMHLPPDQFSKLHQYQELVIKSLTRKGDSEDSGNINLQLEALTPAVKEIAITFKKTTSTHNTEE